jgi:branched-chain amino acid transport system ATP-binding protein
MGGRGFGMPEMLLTTERLSKSFGGVIANAEINLQVRRNELHAIIGPNGAGKTTLVAQLAGQLRPDSGGILFEGRDITHVRAHVRARNGFARSFQITNIVHELTARDNVALAVQALQGHSFRFWRRASADSTLREPAELILHKVGLARCADMQAGELSHGEKRALDIGMALATRPQLLLLDEPLAGMGPEDTPRIITLLATLKVETTILLIEHDMDAVFSLADVVSVLVSGRIIASGPPSRIRQDSEVQRAYLGDEDEL